MFGSYDHHQVEKYIITLGLLKWRRIGCFIRSHITVIVYIILRIAALSNAAPAKYFSGALRKHIIWADY
jgi:hypothetical protein